MDVRNSLSDARHSDGIDCSQDIVDNNCWGWLIAIRKQFPCIELTKSKYTFGRFSNCDVKITERQLKIQLLRTISKIHFKIRNVKFGNSEVVYLEDCSFNGTFVNGEKTGRGKVIVLQNNDLISLLAAPFHVYRFISATSLDSLNNPGAVISQYVRSQKLDVGACVKVFRVSKKKTCDKFVMKGMEKKRLMKGGRHLFLGPEKLKKEVTILTCLRHVPSIGVQNKAAGTNVTLADAMSKTAKTMHIANKLMKPEQVAADMKAFGQASMKMEITEEMSNGILDDLLDESGEEEESLEIEIADEIGLEISGEMAQAPSAVHGKVGESSISALSTDEEMEKELEKLRL